jgi:hypothetical protein
VTKQQRSEVLAKKLLECFPEIDDPNNRLPSTFDADFSIPYTTEIITRKPSKIKFSTASFIDSRIQLSDDYGEMGKINTNSNPFPHVIHV